MTPDRAVQRAYSSLDLPAWAKQNGLDLSDPTPISPTNGTWTRSMDLNMNGGQEVTSFLMTSNGNHSSTQPSRSVEDSPTFRLRTNTEENANLWEGFPQLFF